MIIHKFKVFIIPSILIRLCAWKPKDKYDVYILQTCIAWTYGGLIGWAVYFSNVVTGWWELPVYPNSICVIGFSLISVAALCTPKMIKGKRRIL